MKDDLGWWGVVIGAGSMFIIALVIVVTLVVQLSPFYLIFLFPLLGVILLTIDGLQ